MPWAHEVVSSNLTIPTTFADVAQRKSIWSTPRMSQVQSLSSAPFMKVIDRPLTDDEVQEVLDIAKKIEEVVDKLGLHMRNYASLPIGGYDYFNGVVK